MRAEIPVSAAARRGRVVAALLSMVAPGAGQLYVGALRLGCVLLGLTGALALAALVLAWTGSVEAADRVLDRRFLAAILLADVALVAFRLFAVVDAWRRGRGAAKRLAIAALVVVAVGTAAPHVAAGYVVIRSYSVLDSVFADEEPRDVLPARGLFLVAERGPPPPHGVWPGGVPLGGDPPPRIKRRDLTEQPLAGSPRVIVDGRRRIERPWTTFLLLGIDAGPGIWGGRTDTMIVVALERGTGRAVAIGIPRNLVEVPLGGDAARTPPRFRQPLNALYAFARSRPELFPGGSDPGATALKQAISRLLGIRIDYYALVDLLGFADLIDALGGVDVRVTERIVDSVTRPAWGEPKPTIDVHPGRTYHFFGREALAYVRSRKASSDYTRMARQRCFLSALARQIDVVSVLRRFNSLSATVERSAHTDIPLSRLPDLVRLASRADPSRTLTETLGVAYFARRRASDRYPVPNVRRIRARVRGLILLQPGVLPVEADSVAHSC